MFEVVKAIHRAIPLKTADIMRWTYIGPRGRGQQDYLKFASSGPHDINSTIRDRLIEELRSAGFEVNLDTRGGTGPLGTIELEKRRKKFYMSLKPDRQEGDIELHFSPKGKKRTLGPIEHRLLAIRIQRLLAKPKQ